MRTHPFHDNGFYIVFAYSSRKKDCESWGSIFRPDYKKCDGISRLSNAFCGELLLTHTGENLLKSNCVSLMKVQQSGNGKLCFRYAAVALNALCL